MADSPVAVEDDLDAFSATFFGNEKAKESTGEDQVVEDETPDEDSEEESPDDDPVAENEDDTDEEAEDEESDPDGEEDEPEPEPKKKNRKSFQERIDELTRRANDAERALAAERDDSAKRLKAIEDRLNTPKEPEQKPEGKLPDGAPDADALDKDGNAVYPLGEFDPAYVRALMKFTIAQEQTAAEEARKSREAQAQAEAAREQARVTWNEKLSASEQAIPDIRTKINNLEGMFTGLDAGYGQYLVDIVMSLDNGPTVLAYLSDNPKEAQKIVSSGPASAAIALGRVDARVATPKTEAAPKKVSKAPTPPKTVPRGTGGKFAVKPDTDDLDAFSDQFFNKKR